MAHFEKAQRHVTRSNIFSNFTGDLKKVIIVNFRDVIQSSSSYSVFIRCFPFSRDGRIYPIPSAIENIKTKGQENFPITLYVKGKSSSGPVKTVVRVLKTSNPGHHHLSLMMLIF